MATKKKTARRDRAVKIKPIFALCAVSKKDPKLDIRDCYTSKEAKGIILNPKEKFVKVKVGEC